MKGIINHKRKNERSICFLFPSDDILIAMDRNDTLILAPLAGYTDKAFREICSHFGSDCAVTEMVSAEGLAREGEKTILLMDRYDGEKKLTVQLFAPSKDPVERALPILKESGIDSIDINCGCPVPKVVKTGAGSALMREPRKMGEIVRTLKDSLGIPVSVKFRLGWDNDSINYIEFAHIAVDNGADALTLHARTRAQAYEGKARKEAFGILSKEFRGQNISLYASGDIFTPEDAVEAIEKYGMTGVMFARGSIGNPFIFRETREFLSTGSYTLPSVEEKVKTALEHYDLMVKYFGERVASHGMRKHALAYVKGIRGASTSKAALSTAQSREDYEKAFSLLM